MLKIEVIKFEAQDIITTSGNPVVEDTPAAPQCTCKSGWNTENCIARGWHDECIAGGYEGHHNCEDYVQIN